MRGVEERPAALAGKGQEECLGEQTAEAGRDAAADAGREVAGVDARDECGERASGELESGVESGEPPCEDPHSSRPGVGLYCSTSPILASCERK
jgi:hypothetical protein